MITRREFFKGGIAAFTVSFAAPAFLTDLARAQGAASRNLVVLNLSGGNDGLSLLVPYTDPFYYSRRPTLAIPAGSVLQIGSDTSGKALGLHPKLTGLREIFNQGRLAVIQRAGLSELEPLPFFGHRHLVHGRTRPTPRVPAGWAATSARSSRSIPWTPGRRPRTRRIRSRRRASRWRRCRA